MTVTRKLRLAIVGLGKMGMRHWRTWQTIPDVQLVAAVDIDAQKFLWNKDELVMSYSRCEDLLGRIDAAVIATPPDQHLSSSLPLLCAGIHCLIEKPLALTMADSIQLITTAGVHHARLAVGHSERFNPMLQRIGDILQENIRCIEVFRMATPGFEAEVDVVHDLMVHDIDWLIDALGQVPSNIRILDACRTGQLLSRVWCELIFANGLVVQMTSSRIEKARRRELILHRNSGGPLRINLDVETFPQGKDPLTLQAYSFLDFLRGKTSAIATGMDALQVMTTGDSVRAACMSTETCDVEVGR
ncbi:MAG: Gfo/Idh/MocA family oxidoreductase [Pseudomonadota bacterium]